MKLIIDISKEEYKLLQNSSFHTVIEECVRNGTLIPDNATNGDMMKAIFNCKTSNEDSNYLVKYSLDGIYEEVNSDWWNAPYKAERKDNNE